MRRFHFLRDGVGKYGKLFLTLLLIFLLNKSASGAQRVLFIDDLGRFVQLDRPAVRIVSLSDAHAENLVAIRAVKQIAGVAATADPKWIPKSAARLALPPKIEDLQALKTDLVLLDELWASENSAFMGRLSESGLPFAVFKTPEFDAFEDYLTRLGRLSGRRRDAEQAYVNMMKALRKTEVRSERTDDPLVLIVAGADYATVPKGSWATHVVDAAGGVPFEKDGLLQTADSPRYVAFGADQVRTTAKEADLILTLTGTGRPVKALPAAEILADPRMQGVAAVKAGRVLEIDAATLALPSLVRLDSTLKECWNLLRKNVR